MDNGRSGTYVWTCIPEKTITANLLASHTMSSTIGRNDPCICGSGEKYKRCCQTEGRSATATSSKMTMIILGAVVLAGLALIVISVVGGGGGGACPAGQSWSAAHGHCH